VIRLDAIHSKYQAMLLEDYNTKASHKVDDFWAISAFARRDLFATAVTSIAHAEGFYSGKYVVARTDTPDMKAFAAAFAGIADEVIEGLPS